MNERSLATPMHRAAQLALDDDAGGVLDRYTLVLHR